MSLFALQYFSTATDLQLWHGSGHEGSVRDKQVAKLVSVRGGDSPAGLCLAG